MYYLIVNVVKQFAALFIMGVIVLIFIEMLGQGVEWVRSGMKKLTSKNWKKK